MEPFKSPEDNFCSIDSPDQLNLKEGWKSLILLIEAQYRKKVQKKKPFCIGMDGYLNTDWERVIGEMNNLGVPGKANLNIIDIRSCLKSAKERKGIVAASLPQGEPVFGKKYDGDLSFFFDMEKLYRLKRQIRLSSGQNLFICAGSGALLTPLKQLYNLSFYFDVTREEALKRNKAWTAKKSKTQSVSPRQIYYVDFPMHDRHRKKSLPAADYYVDCNDTNLPKILPVESVQTIVKQLMTMPLRIKPLYEPGVWGGQWLKRNRNLPKKMINCAYGFEIIAPEQSLVVTFGSAKIEFPFNLLMETAGGMLVGKNAYKRYGDLFPVRIAYDDTWEGGNLSIQAHPTTKYMKQTFGEKIHQAEMYYIFDSKPGSIVHLGLKEGIDREMFYEAARKSEKTGKPFDHTEYVNVFPAEKGKIFLIPPGTVHGAGANELVLEISSTPYRYTFKIYDYLRPDLDGSFRPIHIEHAFNNIKFFRKTRWVEAHLIPQPVLLNHVKQKKGEWKEYIIADRREFYHAVHRFEFDRFYKDDTNGKFHLLNLVEGDIVLIQAKNGNICSHEMALSETILLPASVGPYEVINRGQGTCKIVKTFLRT